MEIIQRQTLAEEPEMVQVNKVMMSRYPVTQGLWKAVMKDNPSYFKGDNRPVEQVSWEDTQVFIQKLNEVTGKAYRLPTEAEWTIAATVDNTIYSGSDELDKVAWYNGNSNWQTHPVGQKKPNSLGLYDMSGNVWEWCQDWYVEGFFRVLRGGSWDSFRDDLRSSNRDYSNPRNGSIDVGFRLVLPL